MRIAKAHVLSVILGVALLSGCVAPRTWEQVEQEMAAHPIQPTFEVPPPCDYIAAPAEASALIGSWSVSGTMDGADYCPTGAPVVRWTASWSKSFVFSADGTYSVDDSFNGRPSRATGRWSYADGLLVLDIGGSDKINTHREYRLFWLDDRTFDLRWSSDAAEAAWWKEWVLDKGRHAHCDNSVVVSYDRSGCKRQTSRMRCCNTGRIYDVLDQPVRYRLSGERAVRPVVRSESVAPTQEPTPVRVPPSSQPSEGQGSPVTVEIDSIPL